MQLRELIIPQDKIFFKLLAQQSGILVKGAETLFDIVMNYNEVRSKVMNIKEIEHEGDAVAHELYVRLNKTFVTPLDREDLMSLASKCDDVLDAIYGAAKRFHVYEIDQPTEYMKNFVELILKATREINILMPNIKRGDQSEVDKACEAVDILEDQGDELLHGALMELFRKGNDAVVEIIKNKEIYEWLESALDRCEDVTYAIADIVMKNR